MNKRLGEMRLNNQGTMMKIVRYGGHSDIDVEFLDNFHYIKKNQLYVNFKNGCIKNPYDRTTYGVGYLGVGEYVAKENGKIIESYRVGHDIMRRCYSEKSKEKFSAYFGICSVAKTWHNYQNFANWFDNNKYDVEGRLHIDKDILFPNNKIYCPDMCILTPQRINMLFVKKPNKYGLPNGVKPTINSKYESKYNGRHLGTFNTIEEAVITHDKEKKKEILEVANEYKEIIPQRLYEALLNWNSDYLRKVRNTP